MPKTYIENIENQGGTINVRDSEINLPPHKVPKKLTPQTGLANDIDFVGRKEELQNVDELLNQNSMLLLLNGIGGIGKSTLASYYLNQKKDNFDYYGFVQVNEDIKLSLASAFGTSLDLKSEKIDDLFAEIMNKLQNLEGKKLLIIDDIKEMDSQLDEIKTLMTLKNDGSFQILFTSRETQEYLPQYFLDIMSVEDARELFLKHYPTDEMDKVDKILGYLDYHTLFIEMTARTLKQRKRTLSLDKMIEKFSNGEFSSIKKNKKESFNLFLSDLFSNDKILQDEENLLFLKRLSVLPSIEISFEDLYKFLVCEDEERLEEFLIELVNNGWLIESDGGYKFHQILKEFVYDKYLPTFEEINGIVNSFIKLIGDTGDTKEAINNKNYIPYFESLVEIFDRTKIENWWIGNFLGRFANVYFKLDFFEKAEYIYLKTLKIYQNILGEEHMDTATTYNNLAGFYMSMREYSKAEFFYLKALKIREKIDFHPDTAQAYSNLANLYISMKKYDKIKSFHLKALKIRVKIYRKNHPTIAISYSGLASFYKSIGKYKKAELFYLKALKIAKNELGDKHPDTSVHHQLLAKLYELIKENKKAEINYLSALKIRKNLLGEEHSSTINIYNDLAELYESMGEYQKAEPLYLKALKTRKKLLGEEHPNIAISYNNLALNYFFMGEYQKAESFYLKALKIRKKILGERHSDTASSYNNLGSLYFYQDNYKKAYTYTKKAFEIGLKILSNEHPDLMNYKEGLEMIEEELSGSESFFKYIMQKTNNGKNIDMGNEDKIEILFQDFLIKLMKNFILN